MRMFGERRVRSLLRITLGLAIVLANSSTVARAQSEVGSEDILSFEEVLSEILEQRAGGSESGVENIVAKMLEKQVAKAARRLDVWQCMSIALDQNKQIKEAWHVLQQVQVGDRIITRSRLFPQLDLIVNRTERDNETTGVDFNDTQTSLRLSQRILEFGKDSPAEVSLRASERSALYNLESTVRRVLSQVRQNFYDILLREQQIETRMELLREFRQDWERKKQRFEVRGEDGWREPTIEPSQVLQAEANVMNELGSINSLLREQARSKIALLQVMGEPIGQNIEIEGAQDETIFDVEEAVSIALENSIEIARLEEELEEQNRVVRQLLWEFAPDVNLQTGISRRGEDASLNVSNAGDTWAVDVAGERFIHLYDEPETAVRNERFELHDEEDFFLDLEVRVPILEGFARVGRVKRERSRLRQAEARLQRARELAELDVRQSYESLLDIAMDVQLRAHQRDISRHLFDIQGELRDKLPASASEQEYETFRNRFFSDQSSFFNVQSSFIGARENLREAMGFFE
jgi:outer membrane protein TolC